MAPSRRLKWLWTWRWTKGREAMVNEAPGRSADLASPSGGDRGGPSSLLSRAVFYLALRRPQPAGGWRPPAGVGQLVLSTVDCRLSTFYNLRPEDEEREP